MASEAAALASAEPNAQDDFDRPIEASSFLRDSWYAAAWAEEVQQRPFGVTICGDKIVLVRGPDGTPAALSGVCPHRFASLAGGVLLDGERLQCPYHGLEFALDGRCVANPHGPTPPRARLATYALEERHSIIWLWYGDAGRADPTLIPDYGLLDDHGHRTIRGRLLTRAHFELITDNLLDLSHVAYLHRGGIGSEAIKDGRHEVIQDGDTLHSNRWCPNGAAAPVWAALLGGDPVPVDHWLNMRWDAPAAMWLDVGVTPTGRPRSQGVAVWGAHILTPETERSTHYLWAACRDFALEDEELDQSLRTSIKYAFVEEDKPMIEEAQGNMAGRSFREMKPLILASDKGAIYARRILDELRAGRHSPSRPARSALSA